MLELFACLPLFEMCKGTTRMTKVSVSRLKPCHLTHPLLLQVAGIFHCGQTMECSHDWHKTRFGKGFLFLFWLSTSPFQMCTCLPISVPCKSNHKQPMKDSDSDWSSERDNKALFGTKEMGVNAIFPPETFHHELPHLFEGSFCMCHSSAVRSYRFC